METTLTPNSVLIENPSSDPVTGVLVTQIPGGGVSVATFQGDHCDRPVELHPTAVAKLAALLTAVTALNVEGVAA